jgi:hypothetical protein
MFGVYVFLAIMAGITVALFASCASLSLQQS